MNFTSGFPQPGSNSLAGFYSLVVVMMALAFLLAFYFHKKAGFDPIPDVRKAT